jgi:hypothetical protein
MSSTSSSLTTNINVARIVGCQFSQAGSLGWARESGFSVIRLSLARIAVPFERKKKTSTDLDKMSEMESVLYSHEKPPILPCLSRRHRRLGFRHFKLCTERTEAA